MFRPRVIPCLLLRGKGLVKTKKFNVDKAKYLGDPINAVRIFNEKKADELIFLDILASKENREPDYIYIQKIADECFMPFAYGGGIKSFEIAKKVFDSGAEKIVLNTSSLENPNLISQIANVYGKQSVVVAIDVKKNFFGKKKIYMHATKSFAKMDLENYVKLIQDKGAGEIFVNSVDNDGVMEGYDFELLSRIAQISSIPVVACGGAANLKDLSKTVYCSGVSAVSAGSIFVFHGKHNAVLINYPKQEELDTIFASYFEKINLLNNQ